jgi:hypothetical protein
VYRHPRIPLRRIAQGAAGALLLAVLACSGGKDATGPNGPGAPTPRAPRPTPNVTGLYALAAINARAPGRMLTIANPDGTVIGLYRFDARSRLQLSADRTWSMSLAFADERKSHLVDDQGTFTQGGADGTSLVFESRQSGNRFIGRARNGGAAIDYDFDGDGQPETILGFGPATSGM